METMQIEILNPKAKSIVKSLADLKLITIKNEKKQSEFITLLEKLRANSETAPSNEEALWLKFADSSPSFSFLMDKEEDVYSFEDGEPFQD